MIAASPLLAPETAPELLSQLRRLITDQFQDTTAAGPSMYETFHGAQGDESYRRHAHGTLRAFASALHQRGINLELR